MAMKAEDLLPEALALSDSERAGLAAELLASLDEPDDDPELVAAEWAEEIDRRADAVLAGESHGEPWAVVRQRIADELTS